MDAKEENGRSWIADRGSKSSLPNGRDCLRFAPASGSRDTSSKCVEALVKASYLQYWASLRRNGRDCLRCTPAKPIWLACSQFSDRRHGRLTALPTLCSGQAKLARVARLIGLVAKAPAAFKPFPPLRFGRGSHPSRSVVNFP